MGYGVHPQGRLIVPESDDAAAVAAVRTALLGRKGRFDPEDFPPGATLTDIGPAIARAKITRDEDAIVLDFDDEGDPKWSDHAIAFYVAIAPFVRSGTVDIEGEDGARWSYVYADGQITQHGWSGWDGSVEPFGPYVDPPGSDL
jgi:hypothetical protein